MEKFYSNILEINPQEIFIQMKKDIYNYYPIISKLNINQEYIKVREEIINLIQKMYKKMRFKSRTFFLSIYYLDIIFDSNKKTKLENIHLLGLSCFIVASKYCENDPDVPPIGNFLDIYNKYNTNNSKIINLEELFNMEVKVLKYLNYKLQYVTIYEFNLFFFNHGIIKKQQVKDIINNNVCLNNNKNNKSDISSDEDDENLITNSKYIKKILEKIYKKSRYYLNMIIINDKIVFKYNVLLLSIFIMKKSIEEVILNEYKFKNKDYYLNKRQILKKTDIYFKEVMNDFYKMDYESNEKYQELIKDKNILSVFNPQEKKNYELKDNKNNLNNDIIKFKKVFPNSIRYFKENNFVKKNDTYHINGISNIATSSTIEESQFPNLVLDSYSLKNKKNIGQYNSKQKLTSADNKSFIYYNKNNKIWYTKTLGNNTKNFYNINNNSNIDISNKNITTNNSNSKNKENINSTLSQLKNNLKKNFSLNKKRCKDRYSHINNLKTLCKLTSCANTIKTIKESYCIQNNKFQKDKLKSPDNILDNNIVSSVNLMLEKNILTKNIKKNNKLKNSFLNEEKFYKSNNNSINIINDKKDSLNESNYSNNEKNKNFASLNSNRKEKNLIRIRFRTNTINDNSKSKDNKNKPYFKKLIPNFEPMKKNVINKNSIKINAINKSNTNNFKINSDKNNMNAYFDFISLSQKGNENKKDLIKKRIININKNISKRNINLDNLIINKSNCKIGKGVRKYIIDKINQNDCLIDKNIKEKNNESINSNKNKILKIPKKIKNLKISTNFYQNKSYNTKNNDSNKTNQSPISFIKDIKLININKNNEINNYLYYNQEKDLPIKMNFFTIQN